MSEAKGNSHLSTSSTSSAISANGFPESLVADLPENVRRELHTQMIQYLHNSCARQMPGPTAGLSASASTSATSGSLSASAAAVTSPGIASSGFGNGLISLFDAVEVPRSVEEMMRLIRRFQLVSEEAVCGGILYMQRFLRARDCILTHDNLRPLFLVATALAAKFIEDVTYNNLTFAQLGDIPLDLFNALELEFLAAVRFHLSIDPARLESVLRAFLAEAHTRITLAPTPIPNPIHVSSSTSQGLHNSAAPPQSETQAHGRRQTPSRPQTTQSQENTNSDEQHHRRAQTPVRPSRRR